MLTTGQRAFLEQLECVRFCESHVETPQLMNFQSARASTLDKYLQETASRDDDIGQTAVYLVYHKHDRYIVAFFSLHCGSLFEGFNLTGIERDLEASIADFEEAYVFSNGRRDIHTLRQILLGSHDEANVLCSELPNRELKRKLATVRRLKCKRSIFFEDLKTESNRANINRVSHTFPALELVHFCLSDSAKAKWDEYAGGQGKRHPLGAHLYWQYILPIVQKVCRLVGCKYLFLFAADASPDGNLVNYYKNVCGFSEPKEHGVSKPVYDWTCKFLSADIRTLLDKRAAYFQSLSEVEEPV